MNQVVSTDNAASAASPDAIAPPVPRKTPVSDNDPTREVPERARFAQLMLLAAALVLVGALALAIFALVLR